MTPYTCTVIIGDDSIDSFLKAKSRVGYIRFEYLIEDPKMVWEEPGSILAVADRPPHCSFETINCFVGLPKIPTWRPLEATTFRLKDKICNDRMS